MTNHLGDMALTRQKSLPPLTRANNTPPSPRRQVVVDVFNMFDTDGSGEIELDEIAKAFKTTGKLTDETRAQLKAHFDFMDSDGSGEVTIDEFQSALGHGAIAFRNYQHQQAYHALGLTLCQNLVVYRRHVLNQEFEKMKQQSSSSSSATGGMQAVQDQFDCLVRSLVMSTFALDLKRSSDARPADGGGGGGDEGGGRGKGNGGDRGRRSERERKDASSARDGLCAKEREARVLAQALKVGHSPRHLRPLPPSRRRRLRAEIMADVAAVKKCRDNNREQRTRTARAHRVVLKKLPQRGPRPRRVHGPALAF